MSGSGFGDAEKLAAARELQASHHRSSGGKHQRESYCPTPRNSGQSTFQTRFQEDVPPATLRGENRCPDQQGTKYQPRAPRSPRPPLDMQRLNKPSTLPASLIKGAKDFLQVQTATPPPTFSPDLPQQPMSSGGLQMNPLEPGKTEGRKGSQFTNTFLQAANFLAGNAPSAPTNVIAPSVHQQTPETPASTPKSDQESTKAGLKDNSRIARFLEKRRAAEAKALGQTLPQGSHSPATPTRTPEKAAAEIGKKNINSDEESLKILEAHQAALHANMLAQNANSRGQSATVPTACSGEGRNGHMEKPPKTSSPIPAANNATSQASSTVNPSRATKVVKGLAASRFA